MRFQWNALRVGDRVIVHDEDPAMTLVRGTVAIVDTSDHSSRIGVLIIREGTRYVLRPKRLAVHLDPVETAEPCWRCEDGFRAAASLSG